jgi:hypothetical protein
VPRVELAAEAGSAIFVSFDKESSVPTEPQPAPERHQCHAKNSAQKNSTGRQEGPDLNIVQLNSWGHSGSVRS